MSSSSDARATESTATLLGNSAENIIEHWLASIQLDEALRSVSLSYEERCGYVRQLLHDLARRLRPSEELGTRELRYELAATHGVARNVQGYIRSMMAEEFRRLQVCIFRCLEANLTIVNLSTFLADLMTIADEISFQLSQSLLAFKDDS